MSTIARIQADFLVSWGIAPSSSENNHLATFAGAKEVQIIKQATVMPGVN